MRPRIEDASLIKSNQFEEVLSIFDLLSATLRELG